MRARRGALQEQNPQECVACRTGCYKNEGICEIANDNAEGQIILSGNVESVKSIQQTLKEKKIKFIPLKVSAPFHCSLMRPASENMKDNLRLFLKKCRILQKLLKMLYKTPQI